MYHRNWLLFFLLMGSLWHVPIRAATDTIRRDISPILSNTTSTNFTEYLSGEWKSLELHDINTGKGYHHLISISVSDNISSAFGQKDYYKFKFNYNLVNSVFDPSPQELIVQDGTTQEISINFDAALNDQLQFNAAVLSVTKQAVELFIQITIRTYIVPSFDYDLQNHSYLLNTSLTTNFFISAGSFAWFFQNPVFLFLDQSLQDNTQIKDITIKINLAVENFVNDNDRVRMAINGAESSTIVGSPKPLAFTVPFDRSFSVKISTLSDYLEFSIDSVEISLSQISDAGATPPQAPPFGWIAGIFLYAVSFLLVYKFSLHLHIEKIEKEAGSY